MMHEILTSDNWWYEGNAEIVFQGNDAADTLRCLREVSFDVENGQSYFLREIYDQLKNPIKFFNSMSDFSMEVLFDAFLTEIKSIALNGDEVSLFIEELGPRKETSLQRQFREAILKH